MTTFCSLNMPSSFLPQGLCLAVPSSRNVLSPNLHIHSFFSSLNLQLKCHLLREVSPNFFFENSYQVPVSRASLVPQWLRIHLPTQGTWVRTLVWEDSTCRGATKPVHHNYWACALEPASHNYWTRMPQLLEPVLHNKRSHCKEKPAHHNEEQPLLAATRESLRAATKTLCSQK